MRELAKKKGSSEIRIETLWIVRYDEQYFFKFCERRVIANKYFRSLMKFLFLVSILKLDKDKNPREIVANTILKLNVIVSVDNDTFVIFILQPQNFEGAAPNIYFWPIINHITSKEFEEINK